MIKDVWISFTLIELRAAQRSIVAAWKSYLSTSQVSSCHFNRRRNAFSLVELLIVIAIIGVLVSLTLSGVQAARSAARKMQCSNNTKQLVLGMINHESTHKVFPSNGGWDDSCKIKSTTGDLEFVGTRNRASGTYYYSGIGKPNAHPRQQPGSWAYAILPYIEQSNAYNNIDFKTKQAIFLCNSRARPEPLPVQADSYGEYFSGGWAWAKTDYAANTHAIPNRPKVLSHANVTDGTSHTILIGEKAFDTKAHVATSWHWDEPIFSGGQGGTGRNCVLILTDGPSIDYKQNWGSPHEAGVVFGFGDGSVRIIDRNINVTTMLAVVTPDRGEVEANDID